jgi:hypothetical protein
VSAVDGAVRTHGRGSAALPDTGHCRSRPDSHTRTQPEPAADSTVDVAADTAAMHALRR